MQSVWVGEFRPLKNYLETQRINFRHPCPYTSHQNGRIERKRRHNVEIARTLLAQSKWPLKFRWEACETTVYLINRLPTPVEAPTESLQKASSNRT